MTNPIKKLTFFVRLVFGASMLSCLLATGCLEPPSYFYAPEAANLTHAGVPTQTASIPATSPHGTVEVSSLGVTAGQHGEPGLHVRMAVDNEGDDTPWTVDIREQLVEIPGVGRSAPQFANAGVQTLPSVTVPRRERRVLDLYYPLPAGVHDADDLSAFDFLWKVATPTGDETGRTHINRIEGEERAYANVYVTTWSPYWWYDPIYPRVYYRRPWPFVHWHRRW